MLVHTRPAKQAKEDMAFFKEHGVECLSAPMIEIRCLDHESPVFSDYDILIFTSANAFDCFDIPKKYLKKPVIVVGPQTALAAEDKGFKDVKVANGNAHDIINAIAKNPSLSGKKFLYVRAKDVSLDIAEALQAKGVSCDAVVTYQSVQAKRFDEETIHAIKNSDVRGISFLSARTAENFVRLVRVYNFENALKETKALCISNSVLECVRVLNWGSTHVSESPDGDAMKDLILSELATSQVL